MADDAKKDKMLDFDEVFDNLYEDLPVGPESKLPHIGYDELEMKYNDVKKELRSVRDQNMSLKKENEILKRNISSLYLTAKKEIERKKKQISVLQDREMTQRIERKHSHSSVLEDGGMTQSKELMKSSQVSALQDRKMTQRIRPNTKAKARPRRRRKALKPGEPSTTEQTLKSD